MSVTKQSKYNWDAHFPRLVGFYLQGLSFPEIHKAVVTDDFNPRLDFQYSNIDMES
jgi:hypothetical protein